MSKSRENEEYEGYDFDGNMHPTEHATHEPAGGNRLKIYYYNLCLVNESVRASVIQPPMITNPRIRMTIPTLADRFSFDDNLEPFFEPEM